MTKNTVRELAQSLGLEVTTYSPGDGMTRYRFYIPREDGISRDFQQGGAAQLSTCLGASKAAEWLNGFATGRRFQETVDYVRRYGK